jgi:hypothetical protein
MNGAGPVVGRGLANDAIQEAPGEEIVMRINLLKDVQEVRPILLYILAIAVQSIPDEDMNPL